MGVGAGASSLTYCRTAHAICEAVRASRLCGLVSISTQCGSISPGRQASHTVAYWDVFGRPAIKPKFDRGIIETWWIDPAKAASLKRGP